MKAEIFTLCVNAVSKGDQFTITDTFDQFKTASVPYVVPPFDVVVRLRLEAIEATGENRLLSLHLLDQDGKEFLRSQSIRFHVSPPQRMRTISAGFAFHFPGVQFSEYGEYILELHVDNYILASIPVFVSEP